jgi:D-hydroxyproline dehydrogenase subunit gamma
LITLTINNRKISVPEGTTVAAAVINLDETTFRRSITGDPRGPLCGMGICFECRVTINGEPHQRSCNVLAAAGMEVIAGE